MPTGQLSELAEKILLSLWKMNGVGESAVDEKALRSDVNVEAAEFMSQIDALQLQGFITKLTVEDNSHLSLTSLGLAILRQIEEDKLQELR